MGRRRVRRTLVIFALLALATVGAAAAVAKLKPVKPGDYVLDIDDQNGGYQQGGFAVVKDGSKRSIVVDDQYNGIYYPDLGECDDYSVPLTATTIRISRTGRFHVKDETEIPEADPIKVDWKGHWTKASKVEGTIKVSSGKCSDTQPFSGSRTGP